MRFCCRVCKIDFATMELTEDGKLPAKVRRLGTTSSVLAPPTQHHRATEWVWFWKDSAGKWVEYGDPDVSAACDCGRLLISHRAIVT